MPDWALQIVFWLMLAAGAACMIAVNKTNKRMRNVMERERAVSEEFDRARLLKRTYLEQLDELGELYDHGVCQNVMAFGGEPQGFECSVCGYKEGGRIQSYWMYCPNCGKHNESVDSELAKSASMYREGSEG